MALFFRGVKVQAIMKSVRTGLGHVARLALWLGAAGLS